MRATQSYILPFIPTSYTYCIVYIVFRTGSLAGRVGDWHFGGFDFLAMLYFMAILEVLFLIPSSYLSRIWEFRCAQN